MKIALIRLYRGTDLSGAFYNLQEIGLAKALTADGNTEANIFLLAGKSAESKRIAVSPQINLYIIPASGIGHHGKFPCKMLQELQIDIVHLQSDNMLFAPEVIQYCMQHDIKCHNYIGTIYSDSNNKIKRLLMEQITHRNCKWYQKVMTFAKTPTVQSQLIKNGVTNTKLAPVGLDLTVIPEIIEEKEQLREQLNLPLEKNILVFVGKMEDYKNPLGAIEIIQNLPQKFHLVMIGSGSLLPEVKVAMKGNEERITFLEKVANKEIHKYYKAGDAFINLNQQEIYGMAILEAMYQEMAIYAMHAPGPNFIIKENETGFLFPSLESLTSALQKMKTEQNKEVGMRAKDAILQQFQWKNIVSIIKYW